MGNQFNVRKENFVQTKGQKKSKGERKGAKVVMPVS